MTERNVDIDRGLDRIGFLKRYVVSIDNINHLSFISGDRLFHLVNQSEAGRRLQMERVPEFTDIVFRASEIDLSISGIATKMSQDRSVSEVNQINKEAKKIVEDHKKVQYQMDFLNSFYPRETANLSLSERRISGTKILFNKLIRKNDEHHNVMNPLSMSTVEELLFNPGERNALGTLEIFEKLQNEINEATHKAREDAEGFDDNSFMEGYILSKYI